jgi:hypothetical protein
MRLMVDQAPGDASKVTIRQFHPWVSNRGTGGRDWLAYQHVQAARGERDTVLSLSAALPWLSKPFHTLRSDTRGLR